MPKNESQKPKFDWRLTTFEGSRREQLRRWAQLPLENILLAIEEMQDLAYQLGTAPAGESDESVRHSSIKELAVEYGKSGTNHDIEIPGCTPEPLLNYLKALGILRLVSEQKDKNARGWWKNDVFWLRSTLEPDALVKFFLEEYKPTPIVVPWSGSDFFDVNWEPNPTRLASTPTASKAIEAILVTQVPRFERYRLALRACKVALDQCRIDSKKLMQHGKWKFIQTLRSTCPEPTVVDWIDSAAVTTVEKFAAILGSGGGSDGNTHFSDNFMQNLWDVLPEFDDQRKATRAEANPSTSKRSQKQLKDAMFAIPCDDRIIKRTSSLYDSGAVGGPNATQGMERGSLSNPWAFILALEGTVSFAGAAVKRLGANTTGEAAFPFQLRMTVSTQERLVGKEQAGLEIWLPLWSRSARLDEVLALLREGRAQCGKRPARYGVDMARAVATLGVDSGVQAFHRYAVVKGRVGGDNYNTAASLGRFEVVDRSSADLLRQLDPWLDHFRRAAGDTNAPPRFPSALRRINSAVFEFCKYGGASLFQDILLALGAAERTLATAERFRDERKLRPVPRLSLAWFEPANDGSVEFTVARALASIHDQDANIGPLRANLEPVDWKKGCREWAEKDRAVVWNAAKLTTNLANVLDRRMMDGARAGCERLPLASRFAAPLDMIAKFLAGDLDDRRIADLIWGLMLIYDRGNWSRDRQGTNDASVPRAYALLKLLFLPRPLFIERTADGRVFARVLRNNERGGFVIRPEPSILSLLRAGRLGEACVTATRRLRASGLAPMPGPIRGGRMRDKDWRELDHIGDSGIDPQRLAAALLIPIRDDVVNRLVAFVVRGDNIKDDQIEMIA